MKIRDLEDKKAEMQNNLKDLYEKKFNNTSGFMAPEMETAIDQQLQAISEISALINSERKDPSKVSSLSPISLHRDHGKQAFDFHGAIKHFASNKRLEGELAEIDQEGRREAKANKVTLTDSPNSLVLPSSVLNTVTTITTDNGGGNAIAKELKGYLDVLKEQSILSRLGATFLTGLEGNVEFSAELATAQAEWLTETGEITKSTPTFEKRTLSPKRLGVFVEITNKWLAQTSQEFNAYMVAQIIHAATNKIDHAGIWGGSTNSPTGVGMASGVSTLYAGDAAASSTNADGAALTRADLINMMKVLATNNALNGNIGIATNAAVKAALQETPIISGSDQFVWNADQPNRLMGYNAETTQHIPSNLAKGTATDLNAIIMGNFSELLVGLWSGIELLVDPYTQATSGKTRMIVNHFADVLVRRPESFVVIKDVIA